MPPIYLDHGTTTPLHSRVREAMIPFLSDRFGAPTSHHQRGREAHRVIEQAREAVALLVGAKPEQVLFTASATEANNLAIKGVALAAAKGGRLLAAATEHISVLHPLRTLGRRGSRTMLLPVDGRGHLDLGRFRDEMKEPTLLVSVASASAEIGTLQPVGDVARMARERGALFHCDTSATAGLLPWPDPAHHADLVTLTPHLFNGPQGVAALCVRGSIRLAPLIEGGSQERGLRAGTLPLASIAGFGAAAQAALEERTARVATFTAAAADLYRRLAGSIAGLVFTGDPVRRLPGHLSLCVRGVEAEGALRAMDEAGVQASSGSACTTEVGKPSHVLEALGVDPILARGALTFMFGLGNGEDDAGRAAAVLQAVVRRLRAISPPDIAG